MPLNRVRGTHGFANTAEQIWRGRGGLPAEETDDVLEAGMYDLRHPEIGAKRVERTNHWSVCTI